MERGFQRSLYSSINESVVRSAFLKRDMTYYILESGRDRTETVDLLYVQDGLDYLELGGIREAYEEILQNSPEAMNLVLILVPPGTSIQRYECYHPQGKCHESYLEFFLKELVPNVEKAFSEKGKRVHRRGLLGDSLGGAVSLSITCRDSKLWTHLLLHSAAFSEKNFKDLQEVEDLHSLKVYQLVGNKEDAFVSPISNKQLYIFTYNQEMKKVLSSKQTDVTYFEEEEDHLWVFWQRDVPRALQYFITSEFTK
jgi:enterochelin esterase-like enzyme